MEIRYLADRVRYQWMETSELRESFLLEHLFEVGDISLVYTDMDRAIVGSIVPTKDKLFLEAGKELASNYFTERREIGIINIGNGGVISVDDQTFEMNSLDCLYIGRGHETISFASNQAIKPAAFYLLSYPAHKDYPTAFASKEEAQTVHLGSKKEANERTIYKYIHPDGMKSCQLVMGFTQLQEGSIWNTMSAHIHERRTEIYMYFDIKKEHLVFHFMGLPEETRHLAIRNRQAVISPSWSIHAGAGTSNYSFIWGMGGENQAFDDMDGVEMDSLS